MSTHVPDRTAAKILLDAEALARTLSRIAHEIIERNDDLGRARARRHPHARRPARGAPGGPDRGAERGGGRARRGRHHLPPRRHRTRRRAARRARDLARLRPRRRDLRPRRRRPLHRVARSAPRSRRSSSAAAPRASSSPSSSTAATGSCRSAPTTWARTCRPPAASGSRSSSRRSTAPTGSCSSRRRRREADEASALDRRPRPATTSSGSSSPRARSPASTRQLPTLRGKLVLNLFFESSTRTSSSFELAAKRLSADVMSLKAAGSSVDKGESLQDTVLTLAQYDPSAIVIRHPQIGAPQLVARWSGAAVVNAGDGKHQHPTQALLDLFTMREALGRLEGVHVAIVGDVLHSRVARSLVQALALVGAHTTLVGPPTLLPRGIEALGCETRDELGAIADGRRRLRPPDAARADGVGLRPEPARVRRALGDHAGAPAPGAAGDAPRPDQPRRRDRRAASPTGRSR